MDAIAKILEEFDNWLENEAPKYPRVAKILKYANSEKWILAYLSKGLLFILFLSRTETKEIEEKTTTEMTREVLEEMNSQEVASTSLPSAQEKQVEAPVPRKENTVEQPIPSKRTEVESEETTAGINFNQFIIANEFLKKMEERIIEKDKEINNEIAKIRSYDTIVFWLLIITACITIITIVVGISLIYSQHLTVGVLVGVAGILPGTGTMIFNRIKKDLSERTRQLSESSDHDKKLLQAIQMTLMIPDANRRSDAMAALADRLKDSAIKPA